MRERFGWLALTVATGGLTHCSSETPLESDEVGEAEVSLTNAPTDVSCLRLTVAGPSRTDVRKFPLDSGQRALFRLNGLPVGNASFVADAFKVSCDQSLRGVFPTWFSDPGGPAHLAKIWRYDIATDVLTLVAQHNPSFFDPASATFLTNDEESSGILDASDILGPGWFLLDVQAHYGITGELVQGGQLLALFDPAAAG